MSVYPYHNRIKQRIRAGELVGYEWREDYPGIGECLLLIFKSEPMFRPIRPHKYVDYMDILAHWNRYNGGEHHEREHYFAPG